MQFIKDSVKTTNGTYTVEKNYCCRHFEEKNNKCKECKVGFTSINGQPCHQCEGGVYGSRCAFTCDCHDSERCHHIIGCTNILQKITKEISGLRNREVIVYSICAGAFLFVILLCTACQHRYKQIYVNFRRYQAENRRSRNIPEVPCPGTPIGDIEGIYEVIDESNIMNNIPNVRSSISSVTDTNDTNEYFTPYIHVVEGSNACNSIDNKSESSPTLNDYLATKSDGQSTSSSSYMQESGFSNLNSYPPIVHPKDISSQGYAFTDNTLDTGSSWLEAQLRESSYLNPYQPMVLDMDLHEYTSVNGCSNGPDSLLSDTCTTEIAVKDPHPNQDVKSNIDICEYKSVNDISNETASIKLDIVGDDQLDSATYRKKNI